MLFVNLGALYFWVSRVSIRPKSFDKMFTKSDWLHFSVTHDRIFEFICSPSLTRALTSIKKLEQSILEEKEHGKD